MVGARARECYDKAAKDRQVAATVKGNKTRHDKESPVVENLPPLAREKARDEVGKAVGVSGKSIDHATRVIKQAIPEVVKAVSVIG